MGWANGQQTLGPAANDQTTDFFSAASSILNSVSLLNGAGGETVVCFLAFIPAAPLEITKNIKNMIGRYF